RPKTRSSPIRHRRAGHCTQLPDSTAQVLRPTPGREAAQTTDMAAPIPLTDLPVPEASQDAGRVGAVPNSSLFASNLFSQFLRPTPSHEAAPSANVTPIQPTAPSVVASFGREAARSVFVANRNWEGSAEGISSALTFGPVQKSRNIPPSAREHQGSSRAAIGPAPPRSDFTLTMPVDSAATGSSHTRNNFRLVIPPIRGMKTRKHSRAEPEEPDEVTIRQEQSEEPALKRARPAPALAPPVLPPSVPSLLPPTDRKKRAAARNLRKRDAVFLDSRAVPFSMDGVEENGGPSAQPGQFSIDGVEENGGPSAQPGQFSTDGVEENGGPSAPDQFSQMAVSLYPWDEEEEL
ncbi:hypothetical protein V8F33_010338, partial [Rhypophila sp. PSN 637]